MMRQLRVGVVSAVSATMPLTLAAQRKSAPIIQPPVLTGHTKGVHTVVFSPNGKLLASASYDGTVKLWNPATRALVRTLAGAGGSGIAYSPDGSRLVTGSASGALAQWDTKYWKQLSLTPVHPNGAVSVAYARRATSMMPLAAGTRGLLLASTVTPGKARLFDAAPIRAPARLLHELDCCSATDDPNDNYTLQIWRVGFSPNGRKVATALDHGVILWDVVSGSPEPVLAFTHPRDFAFAPDGSSLVIVGPAGGIFGPGVLIKNFNSGSYYQAAVPSQTYDAVAWSPDGSTLALATGSGGCGEAWCAPTIVLWSLSQGKVLRTLTGHTGAVTSLAYSPDGRLLASASRDNTVRLWSGL